MPERRSSGFLKRSMRRVVRALLGMSTFQFAALFLVMAVVVSVMIVLTIDTLWGGCCNAELEFAGVVTPFLDGLFLVIFVGAMLDEIREEVARREAAEEITRRLNEELEAKVTERTRQLRAAQDELVHKEKLNLLAQVADNVGHELRNPLGVMSNAVYFLKAIQPESDATTREYLGIIEGEIAEADRIVADLLDAVRTKPPQTETIAAAELVGQALRKCEVPDGVAVHIEIPQSLPPLRVDPRQIMQVLWNLITNAVEAMPEGGELKIQAFEDKKARALHISVRDSGNGIALEHHAKLFQPLFTTKARRVGLGLAVVKNLTQVNGGSVEMYSQPGKGATFIVTLPAGEMQQ